MNTQTPPPYKEYQSLYNLLVTDHGDAFDKMEVIEDDEIVENALKYFDAKVFPLIYPAKSYAVAVIYAAKIKEVYGINVIDTLKDPDLFLGQDPYFVPYDCNPQAYDALIDRLARRGDWLSQGWAPQTVEYFELECTEAGIEKVLERMG